MSTASIVATTNGAARLSASVSWAAGSVATATISNAMSLFGLFYLSSIAGLEVGVAGILIFVSKLYDAFTDPIMGGLSDRTMHRLGRRRVYVGVGAILTGGALALFFGIGGMAQGLNVVSALLLLIVLSTSYTVFSVPYLAMPPDLAPEYDSRTRLMSMRVFFLMMGVLLGAVGGPLIVSAFGEGTKGFAFLGLILGAVVTMFGLIAFFGTRGADPVAPPSAGSGRHSLRDLFITPFINLIAVLGNKPFRLLTIVKLLQLAVLATALACTPYFFSMVLERNQADIGKYLGTFTIVGILVLPLLRFVVKWLGKRNAFILLLLGYGSVMASWFLWQEGEAELFFYLRAVLLGTFSTGTLLCALALLPDTMEYDRLVSGTSREGVMSGVFTLVEKVSGAVGPLLVGLLLQSQGLIVAERGMVVEQPESVLLAIKVGMSLVPAAITFSCIPFLLFYDLDEAELARIRSDFRPAE
jgi:GPH family glycoside/pentoside/hexuronide:cation symporter